MISFTYPYESEAYEAVAAAAVGSSDDEGSSDGRAEHRTSSAEHSHLAVEDRTHQRLRAVGSECCRPLRKAGTGSGVHCLQG